MNPRLVFVDGPLAGKTFVLDSDVKTIGRGPANDFDIFDARISQRHCRIEVNGNEVAIVDLQSRNGTFVNATEVDHRTVLKDGDEVRIGSTTFTFLSGDSSAVIMEREP